jgi:hypothetical protein
LRIIVPPFRIRLTLHRLEKERQIAFGEESLKKLQNYNVYFRCIRVHSMLKGEAALPQPDSTAILTRDLQAVASSLLRSCDGMSAVGGSGHYITGAGELLGPGVAKRPGPPIRTRSRARNQQEENYVALPATPIPMRLVISAARPGRLIHDPDKDAERCRAAWGRRLAEERGSCSLQSNTERKPGR